MSMSPYSKSPGPLPCNPSTSMPGFRLSHSGDRSVVGHKTKAVLEDSTAIEEQNRTSTALWSWSWSHCNHDSGEFSTWSYMSFSPKKIGTRAALEGDRREGVCRGKKTQAGPLASCRDLVSRNWSRGQSPGLPGASTRDPTNDKVMRRRPDKQGRSDFQGFQKAAPGTHLKDDICLSDACFSRLLPNFCDTGRKPSPISFQIRINLEL